VLASKGSAKETILLRPHPHVQIHDVQGLKHGTNNDWRSEEFLQLCAREAACLIYLQVRTGGDHATGATRAQLYAVNDVRAAALRHGLRLRGWLETAVLSLLLLLQALALPNGWALPVRRLFKHCCCLVVSVRQLSQKRHSEEGQLSGTVSCRFSHCGYQLGIM
jgi:hypothetical protein